FHHQYLHSFPTRRSSDLLMYEITIGEHEQFKIPFFKYRGTPVGIDIFSVLQKGISPIINMGLAHKKGGHAGAGILKAPLECFEKDRKSTRLNSSHVSISY